MSSDLDAVCRQQGVELTAGLIAELKDDFDGATVVFAGEHVAEV